MTDLPAPTNFRCSVPPAVQSRPGSETRSGKAGLHSIKGLTFRPRPAGEALAARMLRAHTTRIARAGSHSTRGPQRSRDFETSPPAAHCRGEGRAPPQDAQRDARAGRGTVFSRGWRVVKPPEDTPGRWRRTAETCASDGPPDCRPLLASTGEGPLLGRGQRSARGMRVAAGEFQMRRR